MRVCVCVESELRGSRCWSRVAYNSIFKYKSTYTQPISIVKISYENWGILEYICTEQQMKKK